MKLTGMMAALGCFISKLREKGLPFFKLLKKPDRFEWTDEADQALKELKTFLTTPPIMVPPAPKETLLLYISASTQWSARSWWLGLRQNNLSTTSVRSYPTASSGTRNPRRCYTLSSLRRASCGITFSRTRSRSFLASLSEKSYIAATPWDASSSG
jgi:hypothetical protein